MTNRGFSQRTPTRGTNNDGKVNALDIVRTPLLQNRDFRSPECKEIMQSADVNVSNPPFSLFREYIAQVMEYGKLFIIIGNQNAITYREILPHFINNKLWLGYVSWHKVEAYGKYLLDDE